ncbi:amidohydrolase [Acidisphaera sp. L21]|uniref:amidohydrolase family protein n=1 Tax=Acidisphaera sp. L21 TaxID=1641851 RepID=UPI00131D29D8|nr:amidohydrolase family protein [Acidisphaera sp. L21]
MTICDSHIHVVGDPGTRPQVADRTYTAGEAKLETLLRVANPQGVGRFVVVQPSFYGTDNSVTLEAIAALGANGRGVAVIDPARVTPAELAALAAGGITGLRINLYSTLAEQRGGSMQESFGAMAAVAQRYGWHVEVIATAAKLQEAAGLFAQSPVPVVIDHYGVHGGVTPASDTGQALLSLLRLPHIWMKLSAPYRCSDDPLATKPDPDWVAAILDAGSARCVWGSDWPHTAPHGRQTGAGVPLPYRSLDYATVLDDARSALPASLADGILRHNPARLYGFATP